MSHSILENNIAALKARLAAVETEREKDAARHAEIVADYVAQLEELDRERAPEPMPRTCIFCPAILEEGRLRCASCGKLQGDPFLPEQDAQGGGQWRG